MSSSSSLRGMKLSLGLLTIRYLIISLESDYSHLINTFQGNTPKEAEASESSAKTLVWVIVLFTGIIFGLAQVFS